MAQQSILKGIKGIRLRDVQTQGLPTEFKDYCPIFTNGEVKTVNAVLSTGASLSYTERYLDDVWTEGYSVPFYTLGGTAPKAIVRGTFPQFNPIGNTVGVGSTATMPFTKVNISISAGVLSLTIPGTSTTYTISANQFKDRVLPRRLLVTMQGSGGGGGGASGNSVGYGGGSGGFATIILNLDKTIDNTGYFELTIGNAGTGGLAKNTGTTALTSTIRWVNPSTAYSFSLVQVYGGTGGGAQYLNTEGKGGTVFFNDIYKGDYFFTTTSNRSVSGNDYGQSYPTEMAFKCTNREMSTYGINQIIHSKKSAGISAYDGGASILGDGGYAFTNTALGGIRNGVLGSGGGGGIPSMVGITTGGNGGKGVIYLYY